MPRRRRSRAGGPGLWIIGIGVLIAALLIMAGFGYLRYLAGQVPSVDKQTYCPLDGPLSVDVVLIDTSDPIGNVTQADLRNQFRETFEKVPKGGLLEVYSITSEAGKVDQLFRLCNPGKGNDLNEITANPRLAKERWEKAFNEPLEKLIVAMDPAATATSSPIMAAIQAIKLQTFDTEKTAGAKTLTIISDMLEHTDQYSQYRSGPDFQAYLNSNGTQLRANALANIKFDIFYVRRRSLTFKSLEHIGFWQQWFASYGGEFHRAVQLEGDN